MERGIAFEQEVATRIRTKHPDTVTIDGGGKAAEVATLVAMSDGVPIILNGRLCDEQGRRIGKPDVLVHAQRGGYRAVDVKGHAVFDVAQPTGRTAKACVSELSSPTWA